jgi:hypothetical protein
MRQRRRKPQRATRLKRDEFRLNRSGDPLSSPSPARGGGLSHIVKWRIWCVGPGSAAQREERCTASGTRLCSPDAAQRAALAAWCAADPGSMKRDAATARSILDSPAARGGGPGWGPHRLRLADRLTRRFADLSPQAAVRFTRLENRLKYKDLDTPRFWKCPSVGPSAAIDMTRVFLLRQRRSKHV